MVDDYNDVSLLVQGKCSQKSLKLSSPQRLQSAKQLIIQSPNDMILASNMEASKHYQFGKVHILK